MKYSCLVQDDAVSSEVSVQVQVVNPRLIHTCPQETYLNATWPETAPDTDSFQECPKGYAFPGLVRRSCTLNDGLRPTWRLPDYSQCTEERLYKITMDVSALLTRLGEHLLTIYFSLNCCN